MSSISFSLNTSITTLRRVVAEFEQMDGPLTTHNVAQKIRNFVPLNLASAALRDEGNRALLEEAIASGSIVVKEDGLKVVLIHLGVNFGDKVGAAAPSALAIQAIIPAPSQSAQAASQVKEKCSCPSTCSIQ
jgi:hypothetical protein